jgi:hypothetical protein
MAHADGFTGKSINGHETSGDRSFSICKNRKHGQGRIVVLLKDRDNLSKGIGFYHRDTEDTEKIFQPRINTDFHGIV